MAAFLIGAATLGVQATAFGQEASITVSPSTAAPGDTVTISGNHPIAADCAPGAARLTSIDDLFPPDGFGPGVPSDTSGTFSMTYTIPTSTPPGAHQIGMRCGGGNLGGGGNLQVVQAATPTEPVGTTSTAPTTPTQSRATTTTAAPAPTVPTAPTSETGTSDDNSPLAWLVVVVVLVVGAAAVTYLIRRRRAST